MAHADRWRVQTIFIRIESSSAVPIYRQVIDQIKYLVAMGTLRQGDKMPSVRQLASKLAVNQNTILKVYNQLCQEKILQIDRGNGTFVAVAAQTLPAAERRQIVSRLLGEAVVQAVHFEMGIEQLRELLDKEYQAIREQAKRSSQHE
jgi:GntR family transcriptional regulator